MHETAKQPHTTSRAVYVLAGCSFAALTGALSVGPISILVDVRLGHGADGIAFDILFSMAVWRWKQLANREGTSQSKPILYTSQPPGGTRCQRTISDETHTYLSMCMWRERRFDKRPEKYHLAITIFLSDARLWQTILNLTMAFRFTKRALLSKLNNFRIYKFIQSIQLCTNFIWHFEF